MSEILYRHRAFFFVSFLLIKRKYQLFSIVYLLIDLFIKDIDFTSIMWYYEANNDK